MKIILAAKCVHPFHPYGGVQKYVYFYAKALARKGIDVEIVAPVDQKGPRTEVYEGLTYTFLRPSIQKYLEYPIGWLGVHLFSYSLARYLRDKDFDILHAFDLTSYQYLKQRIRKPVIAHIFTDNYLTNPITLGNMANLTASRFDKIKEQKVKITPYSEGALKRRYLLQYLLKIKPMHYCLQNCDRIFIEAVMFCDEVSELFHLEKEKSNVIPVGVDVDLIEQQCLDSSLSRQDLSFEKNDIVLITVNRLAADKGIDKIILALDSLKERNPHLKLIIIGSGYQEREVIDMIEERGLKDRVRHFKNVSEDELYPYYRLSDIYISAFSFPGSSISTLEAMACSLPIITTAQPWLVDEGRNGMVINNNDPDSIRSAIVSLLEQDQLIEQGKISRELVGQYDWDQIAEKAIEQYGQVVNRKAVLI